MFGRALQTQGAGRGGLLWSMCCRAFATAPSTTGASTALTEDKLLKWNPEMDEWSSLLEGESLEAFQKYKSAYLRTAQRQAEIFNMVWPVREIDWSKYEGKLDPTLIADVKKHIAEVLASNKPDPAEQAKRAAEYSKLVKEMQAELDKIGEAAGRAADDIQKQIDTIKEADSRIKEMTVDEYMALEPEIAKECDDEIMQGKWY